MELIYVWIEKFRNIEKSSFQLNKDFEIDISDNGFLNDEEVKTHSKYSHEEKIREVIGDD